MEVIFISPFSCFICNPENFLFSGNKELKSSLRSATKVDNYLQKAMIPNKSKFNGKEKSFSHSDDRKRGRKRSRSRSRSREYSGKRDKKHFNKKHFNKNKFEKKKDNGSSKSSGSSPKNSDTKE